ncbi:hypothetical protein SDC9_155578 [bioreactor metagenome]|uniref:Uncharacterized protein n=1 Tax=bioreactor metagenome TaxID=1076179 RepID=A0A645F3T2_9ZZZZ
MERRRDRSFPRPQSTSRSQWRRKCPGAGHVFEFQRFHRRRSSVRRRHLRPCQPGAQRLRRRCRNPAASSGVVPSGNHSAKLERRNSLRCGWGLLRRLPRHLRHLLQPRPDEGARPPAAHLARSRRRTFFQPAGGSRSDQIRFHQQMF